MPGPTDPSTGDQPPRGSTRGSTWRSARGSARGPARGSTVPRPRDVFRDLAAAVSAAQALSLLGFVAFYLWELTQGASDDAVLVVMSALLILVFAVGIGALARGWWTGGNWPNTPTVVWNLLLLPVGWSLLQAGRGVVALLVGVVAALGIVSAVRADTSEPEDGDDQEG
jgi:hypothetical protein